jgi:hypothetical protein
MAVTKDFPTEEGLLMIFQKNPDDMTPEELVILAKAIDYDYSHADTINPHSMVESQEYQIFISAPTRADGLTPQQKVAIRCAMADLNYGWEKMDLDCRQTMVTLYKEFPVILIDYKKDVGMAEDSIREDG